MPTSFDSKMLDTLQHGVRRLVSIQCMKETSFFLETVVAPLKGRELAGGNG